MRQFCLRSNLYVFKVILAKIFLVLICFMPLESYILGQNNVSNQSLALITYWEWNTVDNYTVTQSMEQKIKTKGSDYQRGKDYTYSEPEGYLLSEEQAQLLNKEER